MKIAGFSIIRNASKFDYPVIESILSVLEICDMFYLGIGDCDDDTEKLITENIPQDKLRIIHSVWNKNDFGKDGKIYADETNKVFQAIPQEYDWAFYIQADEVVHEKYLGNIKKAMSAYLKDDRVEGLLLKYVHFYGSYEYIATSWSWYRYEIRIVKNRKDIYSYRDAQGFRIGKNRKLQIKEIDAYMYHYGWVRLPENMYSKLKYQSLVQTGPQPKVENNRKNDTGTTTPSRFDYPVDEHRLTDFEGTHPKIMRTRISLKNWEYQFDSAGYRTRLKDKVKDFVFKYFGIHLGYKNYKKI